MPALNPQRRERYLATLHLALESTHRPELQDALGRVVNLGRQLLQPAEAGSGTSLSAEDTALLHSSYIGLLFSGLVVPDASATTAPATSPALCSSRSSHPTPRTPAIIRQKPRALWTTGEPEGRGQMTALSPGRGVSDE